MKKPTSYESAYQELQEILEKIQSADTNVDELESLMVRAKVLVSYCKDRLRGLETLIEE